MKYLKPFNESSTEDSWPFASVASKNYYSSALHYFNNHLNNDRALEYINKAIELSDKVSNPYYDALKKMIEERKTKPSFDNNEQQKEAIKEICDNCLAYLKDDNFIVRVVPSRPDSFFIFIGLDGFNQSGQRDYFSWGSVKNHLISFFHYLVKDFTIQDNPRGTNNRGISFVSYNESGTINELIEVDEILNDEIEDDKQIAGISIYIKSEYLIFYSSFYHT
jgi:hypothetical protein